MSGDGVANHLGHFTIVAANFGILGAPAGTGTMTLTAADGDQFHATTASQAVPVGPASADVTLTGTITTGTGRFAAAGGAFVMRFLDTHDESTATGTFDGSFEGHIDLNR